MRILHMKKWISSFTKHSGQSILPQSRLTGCKCLPLLSDHRCRQKPHCFFQAEDGIREIGVTGVQTCALPILSFWLRNGVLAPSGQVSFSGPLSVEYMRSEERRVGKECRSRWPPYASKTK